MAHTADTFHPFTDSGFGIPFCLLATFQARKRFCGIQKVLQVVNNNKNDDDDITYLLQQIFD